jgi:ribonuclease J
MSKSSKDELVFVPLGGVGEIGMNFALYGHGAGKKREWIIVDCGVSFPGPEQPGADLVLPDISFALSVLPQIKGMVITHAHEDHYGAILSLWPRLKLPVYMTEFGAGMLASKAEGEQGAPDVPVTVYRPGERFRLGVFEIEAVSMAHSIPEPMALAIRTPAGLVVHTGDWKIDEAPSIEPKTDENRLRQLGAEGVLAVVCDSTNAMREGSSPTEQAVAKGLAEVIRAAEGRVAISTFSSNVGRIKSIALAAAEAGRQVIVVGRSLKRVIEVADELGYFKGVPAFLDEQEYSMVPRNKTVVLCTGSQGEPRAALAKLAKGEMRNVTLNPGDTVVFSSRTIPGNERAILGIKNGLIDMGVKVIDDGDALVHVSGHPRREELRTLYSWLKPHISVPVHGEAAHLTAHGELAKACGVPHVGRVRNGDVFVFDRDEPVVIDQVAHGRHYKDGAVIGDEEQTGIAERRRLSFAGHVAASVLLDERGELVDDVEVVALGLPTHGIPGGIEKVLADAARGAVLSIGKRQRNDLEGVQEAVRRAIRAACERVWGKKPATTVFVVQV